jgi:hypothetical protein
VLSDLAALDDARLGEPRCDVQYVVVKLAGLDDVLAGVFAVDLNVDLLGYFGVTV